MLTEAEASKKWCPHARTIVLDQDGSHQGMQPVYNRGENARGRITIPVASFCIASNCMSWRWALQHALAIGEKGSTEPRGYCGLAGQP